MTPLAVQALRTLVFLAIVSQGALAQSHAVTFDAGSSGWSISGRTGIDSVGGNPGACLGEFLDDVWGAELRTDAPGLNVDPFLGNLSRYGPFGISVDIRMDGIFNFNGGRVPRSLIVEFRDFNPPGSDYPWVSVWTTIGSFTGQPEPWRTFSAHVRVPWSTVLPVNWGGTGAETPLGEPILPASRTFASVLASVDQVVFSTMVPGYLYAPTDFDCRADNITISYLCRMDLDDGSGTGRPDGTVDVNDLIYFLNQFELGAAVVDIDDGTGTGMPDDAVTIDDLLYYIAFEWCC
jgi:hypothetical protein